MGGPGSIPGWGSHLTHIILIKPFFTDNNLVLVCALVFDPGNAKRNHIKEFESIL